MSTLRNEAHMVPFDTLAYAKKLEARGVEVKQAEAHAEVLAEVLEATFPTRQNLSHQTAEVKAEIRKVESELKAEIGRVESELKAEIGRVESELRAEIGRVESELRAEIKRLESKLDMRFAEVKSDVIRWVFAISFAQAALIISVLKFFH